MSTLRPSAPNWGPAPGLSISARPGPPTLGSLIAGAAVSPPGQVNRHWSFSPRPNPATTGVRSLQTPPRPPTCKPPRSPPAWRPGPGRRPSSTRARRRRTPGAAASPPGACFSKGGAAGRRRGRPPGAGPRATGLGGNQRRACLGRPTAPPAPPARPTRPPAAVPPAWQGTVLSGQRPTAVSCPPAPHPPGRPGQRARRRRASPGPAGHRQAPPKRASGRGGRRWGGARPDAGGARPRRER